jgi:hypothetical protein
MYELQAIAIPRPAEGFLDTVVACVTCGEPVQLRLRDADGVRSERRRQKRLGRRIAGLLLGAGFPLFVLGGLHKDSALMMVICMLGAGMIILTPVACTDFYDRARREDGVISLDPGHPLKEPGQRSDPDGSSVGLV